MAVDPPSGIMGIDLCSYRARIGTFVACRGLARSYDEHSCTGSVLICALCPRPSFVLASMCVFLMLVCAGDVELNPGQVKVEDVMNMLKEFIATTEQYNNTTTSTLKEIRQDILDIKCRVSAIENSLKGVPQMKDVVNTVSGSVEEVKVSLTRSSEELVDVVDDLNNRMRRNNMLVKGLAEEDKEDYAGTERIVRDFFSTKLNMELGNIERAHRIGHQRPNFHRPIIVKFLDFKSKMEALDNGPNLKDISPKVWLEEDFSPKIQYARKMLREFAKSNRKKNERYTVRYNKLHLNGLTYQFNSATGLVVQISSGPQVQPQVQPHVPPAPE